MSAPSSASSPSPAWKTTLSVTVPSAATLPPPAHLPLSSSTTHPLPPPKEAAPVALPSDPLSSKAEVKAMAEPTSLYGPLLEVMGQVREEINGVLTGWKEWEDDALGGVVAQQAKRARRGPSADDDDDEDEEDTLGAAPRCSSSAQAGRISGDPIRSMGASY
jgi:hypothetical protein